MEALYKIVGPNGECLNGGSGTWSLPCHHATTPGGDGCSRPDHRRAGEGWGAPGDWWDVDGEVVACRNGLHLATRAQVPQWYRTGGTVYRAETKGELIDHGDKFVARSVRLLPRDKPAPDIEPLRMAVRRAADKVRRAADKRDRAVRRAAKARTVKVPAAWRNYLLAVGSGVTLPAGHPGRPYQDAVNAAERAYRAAVAAAYKPFDAAMAAYDAAASEVVMPD